MAKKKDKVDQKVDDVDGNKTDLGEDITVSEGNKTETPELTQLESKEAAEPAETEVEKEGEVVNQEAVEAGEKKEVEAKDDVVKQNEFIAKYPEVNEPSPEAAVEAIEKKLSANDEINELIKAKLPDSVLENKDLADNAPVFKDDYTNPNFSNAQEELIEMRKWVKKLGAVIQHQREQYPNATVSQLSQIMLDVPGGSHSDLNQPLYPLPSHSLN